MSTHPEKLIWEGHETLEEAVRLIETHTDLELQLPPDLHFALFTHLCPKDQRTHPDEIDVTGGTEVLEKIAEVRGLEQIRELIQPLTGTGALLQVVSPSPKIIIRFAAG